jgi:flagellar basal-body rod modification protein FlgD
MAIGLDALKGLGLATVDAVAAAAPKKQSLGQEQFLKLMTTQLTHQDPSKPMDNGDFLAQMAQFGTVSGIQDLQKAFGEFSQSISSDQALQAASLVGRYVSAPSDQALLGAGREVTGSFELPGSTPNASVQIIDTQTGEVVRTLALGGHSEGVVPFVWDGMDAAGNFADPGVYKVQVEAKIDGINTRLKPQIQSLVESVTMGNGSGQGLKLNLAGLGAVNFNQVQKIL